MNVRLVFAVTFSAFLIGACQCGPSKMGSLCEAVLCSSGLECDEATGKCRVIGSDAGISAPGEALRVCASSDLAASALHMALLAEFPDSHISRKWGPEKAREIQAEAQKLAAAWAPAEIHKSFSQLMDFDRSLKDRGLNPGTTADFVVATLFAHGLSKRT